MKRYIKYWIKYTAVIVFIFCFGTKSIDHVIVALPATTLSVALDTDRFNYFLQNGYPTGFQFDLLELFAEDKNLNIEFHLAGDSLKFTGLNSGEFDVAVLIDDLDGSISKLENRSAYTSLPFDDSIHSLWIVRDKNMKLMNAINLWSENFKKQNKYEQLKNKYFHDKRRESGTAGLSPYDKLMKKYSSENGLDWRLVAAIVYCESNFQPDIVSPGGAQGLMQIMPVTAEYFGIDDIFDPEENIRGGVKYIVLLFDFFSKKGVEESEILNFVLASYNAGPGIIENCMKAAEQSGLNPGRWDDVRSVIMLSYENKFAVNVRFNGSETMRFVNKVGNVYKHYIHFL